MVTEHNGPLAASFALKEHGQVLQTTKLFFSGIELDTSISVFESVCHDRNQGQLSLCQLSGCCFRLIFHFIFERSPSRYCHICRYPTLRIDGQSRVNVASGATSQLQLQNHVVALSQSVY